TLTLIFAHGRPAFNLLFFFPPYADNRVPHSFPTRRSSDLQGLVDLPRLGPQAWAGPAAAQPGAQRSEGPFQSQTLRRARHRRLRSEEHTSELQSRDHLVCRRLLEKKKH